MKILKFKKTKTANLDKFPAITFDKKITSSWETFKRTAYNFILMNITQHRITDIMILHMIYFAVFSKCVIVQISK